MWDVITLEQLQPIAGGVNERSRLIVMMSWLYTLSRCYSGLDCNQLQYWDTDPLQSVGKQRFESSVGPAEILGEADELSGALRRKQKSPHVALHRDIVQRDRDALRQHQSIFWYRI